MRYMSIITNFGCHYKCPYCIVKENNLHIPRMLTYSFIAEAAHDFWVKRKCGKDYRIVVLKSVEVKRVIDYYKSKNFI